MAKQQNTVPLNTFINLGDYFNLTPAMPTVNSNSGTNLISHTHKILGVVGAMASPMTAGFSPQSLPNTALQAWLFLGSVVGSSAGTSLALPAWTGTYQQITIEVFIPGFASNSVPRILFGTSSALDTAGNYTVQVIENGSASTSRTSLVGINLTNTAQSDYFVGWIQINNQSTFVKYLRANGSFGSHVKTSAPTVVDSSGLWDNQPNIINQVQLNSYNAATGSTAGGNMNIGTYVTVWGRNQD